MDKLFFYRQTKLMLECLPCIFPSSLFALKGGTAINFFIRNMPRLSVDIDLAYIHLHDRETSIKNMSNELNEIMTTINKVVGGATAILKLTNQGVPAKIIVQRDDIEIKIEPNFVLRGTIFPIKVMPVANKAQDVFEFFYKVPVLSFEDIYGGKICAALDRQHPRDLFDIKHLFENEGFSNSLRQAFLVYLLSHTRPIHEVLQPNELEISEKFYKEFSGMVEDETALEELVLTRKKLIKTVLLSLSNEEKNFLVTFQNAEPNWSLFPLNVSHLPSIKWKLINLRKLKSQNSEKHKLLSYELKKKLKL